MSGLRSRGRMRSPSSKPASGRARLDLMRKHNPVTDRLVGLLRGELARGDTLAAVETLCTLIGYKTVRVMLPLDPQRPLPLSDDDLPEQCQYRLRYVTGGGVYAWLLLPDEVMNALVEEVYES